MGKKVQVKFTDVDERQMEAEEDELEKEMAALEQIRKERESKSASQSRGVKRKATSSADEESEDEGDSDDDEATGEGYNRDAMLRCLSDWETAHMPFLETLKVEEFVINVANELDDIEREVMFYNHALRAVQEGQKRLKDLGVPTTRPSDYFCEQIKSDAHMARVKDRLLVEQKRMEAFEQRKNREQNRKFNKQLVLKKKKEKSDESKELLNEIDEIKKGGSNRKGGADDKLERILNREDGVKSKKRINMDKKYGFGGRDKKRMKKNDTKSLNNFKEFNPRGGKFNRLQRKGKAGAGKNRPGKDARSARRAGKSG